MGFYSWQKTVRASLFVVACVVYSFVASGDDLEWNLVSLTSSKESINDAMSSSVCGIIIFILYSPK